MKMNVPSTNQNTNATRVKVERNPRACTCYNTHNIIAVLYKYWVHIQCGLYIAKTRVFACRDVYV